MIIGLDINQTLRDLNRQINAVWERTEYGKGENYVDMDEVDKHDLKNEIEWNSIQERDAFFYQQYAYELFGCAPCMTNLGYTKFDSWAKNAENFLDDDVKFIIFSPFEAGLSIKSTLFFLSKFTMLRNYEFPAKVEDMWDKVDVMITANDRLATSKKKGNKVLISIDNPINKKCQDAADLNYKNLEDMVDDLFEYDKLYQLVKDKKEGKNLIESKNVEQDTTKEE